MPGIVLPEWVAANAQREKFAQQSHEWQHIDRQLKELDPQLSLVYVPERVPAGSAPGMLPGRWHVKRSHPDEFDIYIPICGPQGEYRDPESDIVDAMRARDLWKREVYDDLRAQSKREAEAAERKVAEQRAERVGDLAIALRAHGASPVKSVPMFNPARKKAA